MNRPFAAMLGLIAAVALTLTPVPAAETTQTKAYDLLQTRSTQHEMVDAYLLGLASTFIFPELLDAHSRDHVAFTRKFGDKFAELGMKTIKVIVAPVKGTEVSVMSNDRAVLVVFRGSESADKCAFVKDWTTNLNAGLLSVPELGKGVKVHKGMWKAMDSVYDTLVKEVAVQGGFKSKRVYVTGHSLGGALATLCGIRLQKDGLGKPIVYSFGSPRVGNARFRDVCDDLALTVHRWVYKNDIVPMLPSALILGYRHVGLIHNVTRGGLVKLNDSEMRGFGNVKDHHVYRYLESIYEELPKSIKDRVPAPPGS
jgi:hypothetical protein